MSQDNETCAKCGVLCGYDDRKGNWFGERKNWTDNVICSKCRDGLVKKFREYFGIEVSHTDEGIELEWDELNKILSSFVHDCACCQSIYKVTDKERCDNRRV